MRKFPLFWLSLLLGGASAGCGSKGSVALTVIADNPEVTVESGVLASEVAGSFRVELTLGEYAEDSTSVSLGAFSIQRDAEDVLSPLSLGGQTFPVIVDVGASKSFTLTFLQDGTPEEGKSLCEGDLELVGSFTDSLSGDRPTPARTAAFEPSCD
ncbi:MAG TPA: hypothetical protein VGK73_13350 [Polyangiaceae bacterium]